MITWYSWEKKKGTRYSKIEGEVDRRVGFEEDFVITFGPLVKQILLCATNFAPLFFQQ